MTKYVLGRPTEIDAGEVLPSTPASKMSLEVFAGNKDNLRGAIKAINGMMNEHCRQQVINHEAIKMLSEDQESRIHTAELRYETKVQIEKKVGRIEVLGKFDDILAVVGQIHEILHEVKEDEHKRDRAEMLAKDVEWEYELGAKFEKYASDINAEIESAYLAKKRRVKFSMEEERKHHTYTIDFAAMRETDLQNGKVINVRRKDNRKGKIINRKITLQP